MIKNNVKLTPNPVEAFFPGYVFDIGEHKYSVIDLSRFRAEMNDYLDPRFIALAFVHDKNKWELAEVGGEKIVILGKFRTLENAVQWAKELNDEQL
jgi:hypothetical protein